MKFVLALRPLEILSNTSVYVSVNVSGCAAAVDTLAVGAIVVLMWLKVLPINPKTIRYYEEIGLLPPAPRTESGYRQYGDEDAERLEFIRNAQVLGIALGEIKEVLAFRDRGAYPCPYVLGLIEPKLLDIESRIQGLRFLAGDLRRLRKAATAIPPAKVRS